ncbi:hypothetical protein ACIP02_08500 [Pseudomonas sp. NPDC089408]|uniref:hypothetical protein n=1 Tax=Pseudomonas sp. NPDC089408 TaxID=3364465 RepID=UPI0038014D76
MDADKFFRGAVNHLSRGRTLLGKGKSDPAYLFYSALELRFGIESRLREYLEHQKHVTEKKKQGWQIAALGRNVEEAFAGCTEEVRVTLLSGGYPLMLCKYTPVTPELRSIGERLGNYLHAPKSDDLVELEQWCDFESLLEKGFANLAYACSGNLLGVPLVAPGSKRIDFNMSISEDQRAIIGEIYKRGGEILLDFSYVPPAV